MINKTEYQITTREQLEALINIATANADPKYMQSVLSTITAAERRAQSGGKAPDIAALMLRLTITTDGRKGMAELTKTGVMGRTCAMRINLSGARRYIKTYGLTPMEEN